MDTPKNLIVAEATCEIDLVPFIQGVMNLFPVPQQEEAYRELRPHNNEINVDKKTELIDSSVQTDVQVEVSTEVPQLVTFDFYSNEETESTETNVQQINTISPITGTLASIITPLPASNMPSHQQNFNNNMQQQIQNEYEIEYNESREVMLREAEEKARVLQNQWERDKKSLKVVIKEVRRINT